MNRPTTSWPCCLSSQALTAESTPPDRPTTTRCFMRRIIRRCLPARCLRGRGGAPHLGEEVVQLLRRRRQRAALAPDQADAARHHRLVSGDADQQRVVLPGIAIDGTAATPSPASTRPSSVVTCCGFVQALRPPRHAGQRLVEQQAVARRSCDGDEVVVGQFGPGHAGGACASGWSRRQAATKRSSSSERELDVGLLAADEVQAEIGLAARHRVEHLVGAGVEHLARASSGRSRGSGRITCDR